MEQGMLFQEALELYRGIYYRGIYQRYEQIQGREWGFEGSMIELAKHVMVAESYYYPGREQSRASSYGWSWKDRGLRLHTEEATLVGWVDE